MQYQVNMEQVATTPPYYTQDANIHIVKYPASTTTTSQCATGKGYLQKKSQQKYKNQSSPSILTLFPPSRPGECDSKLKLPPELPFDAPNPLILGLGA